MPRQPLAERFRPTVLPHNGGINRASRLFIPNDRCLSLGCDAQTNDMGSPDLTDDATQRFEGSREVILRIMLHPAGPRKGLRKFRIGLTDDPAVLGDRDDAAAGRPKVDGQDGFHPYFSRPQSSRRTVTSWSHAP